MVAHFGAHGRVIGAHGRILGAHGRVLGAYGCVLGAYGCVLGAHGRVLGAPVPQRGPGPLCSAPLGVTLLCVALNIFKRLKIYC